MKKNCHASALTGHYFQKTTNIVAGSELHIGFSV